MSAFAVRTRRELTAAEEHMQIAEINALLNETKDALTDAIEAEKMRVARALVDGRHAQTRLKVTGRMLELLAHLYAEGKRHAEAELRSMGYLSGRREFAIRKRDVPGRHVRRLEVLLGSLTVRTRQHAVLEADIGSVAKSVVLREFGKLPGARDAASRLVSGAFDSGLAVTFENYSELVGQWQYSAVLDDGTCDVCEGYDGELYDSWGAISEVLPDGGPNPNCFGGERCRCRPMPASVS